MFLFKKKLDKYDCKWLKLPIKEGHLKLLIGLFFVLEFKLKN